MCCDMHELWMPVMYMVLVCFGIVTISVLCTVIEIKTEVELICIAVCPGVSLQDLDLEHPIFKSAHNKNTREGFFPRGGKTVYKLHPE